MAAKKGRQTPTVSSVLPYRKSDGNQAVKLYEETNRKCQPWQKKMLKDMLAKQSDGLWTHTKFGYSVPRRNGKNEVVLMRELYGLAKGQKILHTAHRTTTSHSAWERLCSALDRAGIEYKSIRASGRETIERPDTGGKIDFRTRSSKGGLGEGFDLLVIDEAQEYTDDQESALKYVVTDSMNPQTVFCGTPPTNVSSGTVFVKFRKKVLEGTAKNSCWQEWSVPSMSDPHDVKLWYETNPSLGTVFTERSIEDEIGTDDVDFNIQRLGLWIEYNQKSAISPQDWDALKADRLPALKGKLYVGIKYGVDDKNVAMAIAVKTAEGRIFVEVINCFEVRLGNLWILQFLKQADIAKIVVDGASRQSLLQADMKDYGIRKKPVLPTVKEVIAANTLFEQAIFQHGLQHCGQPGLNEVISFCDKRAIGNAGGFGYKSQREDLDIAVLDAVIMAYWLCNKESTKKRQRITY